MFVNYLVYYSKLPVEITSMVGGDKSISMIRDGLQKIEELSFPRISLRLKSTSPSEDVSRERKVVSLLKLLKASGKIVDFKKG